ncbi:MAG: hypothetical protein ACRD26_01970 [Vicinamibacterales bacterium]
MTRLLFTGLTCCLVLAGSSPLTAANFKVTLSSIKVEARPGQVLTRHLQLTLDQDQLPTQFKVHVEDWWRSEDGTQSFYAEPGRLKRSCATWVSMNPVEVAVEPGAMLTIRVTISVPADLPPGGYWCALTIDEVPNPRTTPPDVSVQFFASASTGVFVYVDPVERAARILDVMIDDQSATIKVQNDGNAPLGVEGRFEFLRSGDEQPVAVATLPRGTLLPEPITVGAFRAALPDAAALPSGRYLVRAIIDIGLDHYIGVQRELDVRREPLAQPRAP